MMLNKNKKEEKEEKNKSLLERRRERKKALNEKVDAIMKKNFSEYESQDELERFIEKKSSDMIKGSLDKINLKEKEINKKLNLKEKETEKKANEKLKEGNKKIKEKLKWYNKLKS